MDVQSVALSGIASSMDRFTGAAVRIAHSTDLQSASGDTVGLSAEMLALLEAKNAAELNLRVLKTANDLSAEVLKLLG